MALKTLVSLVSDQTIPNVELIKEFGEKDVDYLFITTKQMQKQLEWIVNTTKINSYAKIEVDAFNQKDIIEKLNNYDFGSGEIILNVTGGTKLMSLVINEYFKNLGAIVYYLTGHSKTYVKLFPYRGVKDFVLRERLSLKEYLEANGFGIVESEVSSSIELTERFLNFFVSGNNYEDNKAVLRKIQSLRKKKKFKVESIKGLQNLLKALKYKGDNTTLTKYDARYITGDWFEEYIFFRVKKDLELKNDEIGIGYKLTKENVQNEIDILFVFNHKLYTIECKTSFYDYRLQENGEEKKINLMGEIIYKSDALRAKFGLFARTYILTLGEMRDEKGNILQNFKDHVDRAEVSKIQIISRKEVLANNNMKDLLKIK